MRWPVVSGACPAAQDPTIAGELLTGAPSGPPAVLSATCPGPRSPAWTQSEPSATLGSARLGCRARLHGVGHLAQLAAPRGSHSAKLQDLVPGLRANASVLALPVP